MDLCGFAMCVVVLPSVCLALEICKKLPNLSTGAKFTPHIVSYVGNVC